MAMMDFDEQRKIITEANEFDVCVTCANEMAKEKNITLNMAKTALEGTITNEKVVKFSEITTTVICSHCIKKFHDEMFPAPVVEETPIQEKEVKANEAKPSKTKK